jgi:60S ribosome subunit biogenesis protein NIP7
MRALTDVETQTLFTKLANYTGRSLNQLIAPSDSSDENDRHVFRLHESRVYYVRLSLANLATSVARDNLLSLGTCMGKFTKTGKFRLHITALDVIAPHARYKLWVKQNGEMPFLYGGNIVKAHVGRWSEDCPEHSGVVILSMDDTPLGFGVTARSTAEARKLDPTAVVAFRQGDVGEYLREVCDFSCNMDYISLTWRRKRPCSPLESLSWMLYTQPHRPSGWHSFSQLKKWTAAMASFLNSVGHLL